eukprot:13103624-Ditylum_brightwellii.AAC.1
MLLSFGQDECIFKQYLMHKKAWQTKDGWFRIRPKDDGNGVMGKQYFDTNAAKKVQMVSDKKPLEEDPFVRLFEYGNAEGKEGYWSYDHMVLQLED